MLIFRPLDIGYVDGSWWVSILDFEGTNWTASLLHIGNDMGHWNLDLLWLRPLRLRIEQWLDKRQWERMQRER